MFPNLKLLLTKINLGLSFLPKVSLINEIDFVFENLRLNFLVITKSTLSLPKFSIFCFKLDNLKFYKFELKNIFGIGSKVKTPIFEEYFFLYFFANLNNF